MIQHQPLVSIVMPAYQAAETLERSVRAVMDQSMPDWELLLLVDAATDDTLPIAERLASEDQRIRLCVSRKNRGVVRTRNIAVRLARGQYLAFCDSDDWWERDKLTKQLKLLSGSGANFCYTSAIYVRLDLNWESAPARMPGHLDLNRLLKGNPIGMSTVLMDIRQTGKFYFNPLPAPYVHEDYAYWVDLFRLRDIRTVYLPEATTRVSIHKNTRSGNKWLAMRSQYYIIRRIAGSNVILSALYIMSYVFLATYKRGLKTIFKQSFS
jgi:teichuronic acid biosynthesis glycosyltransferase TuaG